MDKCCKFDESKFNQPTVNYQPETGGESPFSEFGGGAGADGEDIQCATQ